MAAGSPPDFKLHNSAPFTGIFPPNDRSLSEVANEIGNAATTAHPVISLATCQRLGRYGAARRRSRCLNSRARTARYPAFGCHVPYPPRHREE
jgi:hypothetical protein